MTLSDAASAPTPRYYYAPNTYKQLKIQQLRKEGVEVSEAFAHEPFTLPVALFGLDECRKLRTGPLDFMRRVMGPMLLLRFFALPAPLLLAGAPLYWAAVANLALADALSNIHSFIIIATNHCGKDMYKFENSVKPRSGSFYMRAITSSANFRTSNGRMASFPTITSAVRFSRVNTLFWTYGTPWRSQIARSSGAAFWYDSIESCGQQWCSIW